MYFGESAINNYYFENVFKNDIELLNELSIADIGKFIIKKIQEFWKKFLELLKVIKSKIIEFFSKIFKKSKKVKKYKTIVSNEEAAIITEEVKYEVIRQLKISDLDKIVESGIIDNSKNFFLCQQAIQHYLYYLLLEIEKRSKSLNTIKSEDLDNFTKEMNEMIQAVKEESINNFDKKVFSITWKELIKIKDKYGSSYLNTEEEYRSVAGSLGGYITEDFTTQNFNFLTSDKEIESMRMIPDFLKDSTLEKIQNIINYYKDLEKEFADNNSAIKDLSYKQSISNYINALQSYYDVFQQINRKIINCLIQENNLDKKLEEKYLSATVPSVREEDTDTDHIKIINDKNKINKDKKERKNEANSKQYPKNFD